jgi:hypothetical protein
MSTKQQMAQVIAELPESASLEEAFDRLYKAFKDKLRREARPRKLGVLVGQVRMADDFDAPLPDSVLAEFEGGQ